MIRLALEEKIGVDAANPHYERASTSNDYNAGAPTAPMAPAEPTTNGLDAALTAPGARDGVSAAQAPIAEQPTANGVASPASQDDGMYL